MLNILRSFEQATVPDNVVSAFAQVGVHSMLVDRANFDRRVTYTDPTTARLVVEDYGAIALPAEFQVEPAPTWQLRITELISGHHSEMARQLRLEPAEIRAALAPPPPTPEFVPQPPLTLGEAPRALRAARRRRAPPRGSRGAACSPSSPPRPGPRSAFRRAGLYPPHPHSGRGYEVLPGSGGSPLTQGPGPF